MKKTLTKEKIVAAFNSIDIAELLSTRKCTTCESKISNEEYEAGERSCFRCWSK